MKKRILAVMLACLMLTGCGPRRTEPIQAEPETEGAVIAYVPLDDRPDNVGRVVYLAESLGYTLKMPEADDYRTRLKDQPLNENGTQYGDRADLYEWLLAQEAEGCDRYVISMDQLLSGGLVNSRSMYESVPVELSDGTTLTEMQMVEQLLASLTADSNNRVWILDSVMRLAPTVGYDHWDLDGYNALRAYGMEARPDLSGEDLTPENIALNYRLSKNGAELSLTDFDLKEAEVAEYLAARSRKLGLTGQMQTLVAREGYEKFRVLIGIDDSSSEECIQKNEIAWLQQGLREGDALLSGVDDLAFKAVSRLYLEEIDWEGADACVLYYGETEDQPACAYDYKPLTEIMSEHLEFFGLREVLYPNESDFVILVLTQPKGAEQKAVYCTELIESLKLKREAGLPTILIDAGNGQYGTSFHEMLTEETELGWLMSYAGFLDMAIVTGTAMSHGVARYAFLQNGEQTESTERAFARTLADSVLKDFCYKHIVRNDILNFVRGDLAGNADNFWQPPLDLDAIQTRLESGMDVAVQPVIENLERSNMISALAPAREYAERGWGGVETAGYYFPWDRAFEIEMEIFLGEFTEPHEALWGVYYK